MSHINKLNIRKDFAELVHLNEGKKETNLDNPCIYVANLGAYNAGRLVGRWLDLTELKDIDELKKVVDIIANTNSVYGDEWAIHDYSNFPNMGENPDLEKVIEVAEIVEEHGFNKINAFLEIYSIEDLDNFEESYNGEWSSFQDYAEDFFDSCYEVPENISNYIDYEAFARDLSYDYNEVDNPSGGVFVFGSF